MTPYLSNVATDRLSYAIKQFEHILRMKVAKISLISKIQNELLSAWRDQISIVFDQTSFGVKKCTEHL